MQNTNFEERIYVRRTPFLTSTKLWKYKMEDAFLCTLVEADWLGSPLPPEEASVPISCTAESGKLHVPSFNFFMSLDICLLFGITRVNNI